jgi:hypothetical protein
VFYFEAITEFIILKRWQIRRFAISTLSLISRDGTAKLISTDIIDKFRNNIHGQLITLEDTQTKSLGCYQSLLLAKACPKWDFKYFSNDSALALSLNARYVTSL